MKLMFQPLGGNVRKGKAQDVGALVGVFDETANLNPPDLAKLRTADKLPALQELHAKAGDHIGAILKDLKKIDEISVIEGTA
jgi:hypothetical protein